MAQEKTILIKVIKVNQPKKDGTSFVKYVTINSKGEWHDLSFGNLVNEKLFTHKVGLIKAYEKDVHIPKNFDRWVNKEGKTIYPTIRIDNIIEYKQLKNKSDNYYQDVKQTYFDVNGFEQETDDYCIYDEAQAIADDMDDQPLPFE